MSLSSALKKLLTKPYDKVSAQQAAALLEQGAVLLDVRESHEWRAGHAPQARHVPLGELAQRLRELPTQRPVVTVCRSGSRSARAAVLLAREDRQVSNLAGGMRAWARAGLPVVAKGGGTGRIS